MRKLPWISSSLILFIAISIFALGISGCGKKKVVVGCNISSAVPTTGCPADTVTISGSNFGNSSGAVSFDSITATVTSWSDTSIVLSAAGGDYTTVTVTLSERSARNER